MKTLTDEQLMDLIRQSDKKAFEELFNRHSKELTRYITYHLYDKQEAEDIVSNLYISLWHHRETIKIQGEVRAFMYVVVKNKMKDFYKHDKVKKTFQNARQLFSYSPSADANIHKKEFYTFIKQQLLKLTPAHRNAIKSQIMHEYDSHRCEKSKELNISENTFKTNLRRARIHLRKSFRDFLK